LWLGCVSRDVAQNNQGRIRLQELFDANYM